MSRDINKLLQDILDSIVLIESYFEQVPSLTAYQNDLKTIDAVERRLAIIGEALWKADKMDDQLAISNKKRIIGLRHILVHRKDLLTYPALPYYKYGEVSIGYLHGSV